MTIELTSWVGVAGLAFLTLGPLVLILLVSSLLRRHEQPRRDARDRDELADVLRDMRELRAELHTERARSTDAAYR